MNKGKSPHANNIRCRFDRSKKQAVFVRESHLEDPQLSKRMEGEGKFLILYTGGAARHWA
jgi:hypothetical protein